MNPDGGSLEGRAPECIRAAAGMAMFLGRGNDAGLAAEAAGLAGRTNARAGRLRGGCGSLDRRWRWSREVEASSRRRGHRIGHGLREVRDRSRRRRWSSLPGGVDAGEGLRQVADDEERQLVVVRQHALDEDSAGANDKQGQYEEECETHRSQNVIGGNTESGCRACGVEVVVDKRTDLPEEGPVAGRQSSSEKHGRGPVDARGQNEAGVHRDSIDVD